MEPNPEESNPTPPEILALRRLFFFLIGGEGGCPRERFFPLMLLATTLVVLAQPHFIAELIPGQNMQGSMFDMGFADIPLLLGVLLAQAASCLSGGLFLQVLGWLSYACGGPLPGFESPALNLYLGGIVLLLFGSQMFILACRRLRDAGYSRWHLLAGFTYALFPAMIPFGGVWLYTLLSNLGGLWLLWLYTRPTRPRA